VTLFGAGGNVASDNNREASHHFTLGADMMLFGGLIWYARNAVSMHPDTLSRKYGPAMMVAIGSILTVLDPTRHVLLDHGGGPFRPEDLSMYGDYPKLSPIGRFCRASTIAGLICLVGGIAWTIDLPAKLSKSLKQ